MKGSKPEFKRQESWRYKRVAENWRRPRGVTSKMRKEESGFPAKVKIGYGSASGTRGVHPRGLADRLVYREKDLESLDPALHIVRISRRVGERKRLGIVAKAKERNFHVANPGKAGSRPVSEEAKTEEKPPTEITESSAVEPEEEVAASDAGPDGAGAETEEESQ